MQTAMTPSTAAWMRRAVVCLVGFAFVGNAGHSFALLHEDKYANQSFGLALGGAVLPDILLLISVVRLRHGAGSFWGWQGLVLSTSFVLWAGLATADPNVVARAASVWPLAVAITAAGLLEYGDRPAPIEETQTDAVIVVETEVTEDPVPVIVKTPKPKVEKTPVAVGEDPRFDRATEIVLDHRAQTGAWLGKVKLTEALKDEGFKISATTSAGYLVLIKGEHDLQKEEAHG